jgi:hypothetical protein
MTRAGDILLSLMRQGFNAEPVDSPTAADFDTAPSVASASGYPNTCRESSPGVTELSSAAIVQRVAEENLVKPRLLLARLESRAGCVYDSPTDTDAERFPTDFRIPDRIGLYQELSGTATGLSRGYHGGHLGTMVETRVDDGGTIRRNPILNVGSLAARAPTTPRAHLSLPAAAPATSSPPDRRAARP